MSASGLRKQFSAQHLVLPALVSIAFAYLYFRFTKVFKCPSCYLFSDAGDGLKNYFTSAYWVARDKGLWFDGMNYPYGEHPVYTDNQPAWSLLMKGLNLISPMENHVIGMTNMLMLISVLVAIVAVYFLIRSADVPRWYAALVTLPIVFLSPQLLRFTGHYSLAYVCYLPLFLLFIMRWFRNGRSWVGAGGIVLWITWMGFTHLYYFFIAIAFLVCLAFVLWVRLRFRWNPAIGKLLLIVAFSGLTVYLPVKLTDPVTDRPEHAYGIYTYTASPEGTFLPWHGTWRKIWEDDCGIKMPDAEGRSYIGIAGLLLAPLLLFIGFRRLFRRRSSWEEKSIAAIGPGIFAWAGFLVWFIATGWIYLIGGSVLLDLMPVLGQFRSLGRLAWIAYYTYLCYAVVFVYHAVRNLRPGTGKSLVTGLCGVVLIFWLLEADSFTDLSTNTVFHQNTIFRGEKPYLDILNRNDLAPEDFQAILQVPLMFIGTENLLVMRGHWEFNHTFQCSWETGLPIVNYNMSRTSVSHALSILQLISSPDIHKDRLDDMDERPLLLLTYKATHLPTEQRLVDHSTYLGSEGTMDVYRLELNAFTTEKDSASALSHEEQLLEQDHFDDVSTDISLSLPGAFQARQGEPFYTYTERRDTSTDITFACWVYIDEKTPAFPAIQAFGYDPAGSQILEHTESIHSFDPWQVIGHWVEIRFPLPALPVEGHYTFSLLSIDDFVDDVRILAGED